MHYCFPQTIYTQFSILYKTFADNLVIFANDLQPIWYFPFIIYSPSCIHYDSPTERRKTERRMTKHRMTERQKTEHPMTEHRMTEHRIGPNAE